jgi:hypothetical protein
MSNYIKQVVVRRVGTELSFNGHEHARWLLHLQANGFDSDVTNFVDEVQEKEVTIHKNLRCHVHRKEKVRNFYSTVK